MDNNNQIFTDRGSQETVLPKGEEMTEKKSPPVAEITDARSTKKDEIQAIKSIENPKSPEKSTCSKTILVESPKLSRNTCVYITPMPSSTYEEYFNLKPKSMFF